MYIGLLENVGECLLWDTCGLCYVGKTRVEQSGS